MANPPAPDRPRAVSFAATLLGIVLIMGILAWAKAVLIPIALAILLTFVLSPLVTRLDRWGLGRVPAVLIVVVTAGILLSGLLWVVGAQLYSLANDLPNYQENMREKFAAIRDSGKGGTIEKVKSALEGATRAPETPPTVEPEPPGSPPRQAQEAPLLVRIAEEEGPQKALGTAMASLVALRPGFQALATFGLALVLLIFMLITREDLRNRLVSLTARGNLATTTKALDDAGRRIARYLLAQLIINATFGLLVGVGLLIIGVPYALLWGLCAGVFRYIPYIGPWMAALLPMSVSLITSPAWTQVLLVLGLFLVLELVSNNAMEPWLYGQGVGVSVVALLVSATFWAFIWGPVGLIMATPLTVCLVVLGEHVPALSVLGRLLGDQPALGPDAAYLQRLIARDEREATEIVRQYCEKQLCATNGTDSVYDDVLIPALAQAREDRIRGVMDAEEESFAIEATQNILAEIAAGKMGPQPAAEETPSPLEPLPPPVRVLGCAAHQEAEELTLYMLDEVLKPSNFRVDVVSMRTLPTEVVERVERDQPPVVVIAVLPPGGLNQAQYLCKLLRKRFSGLGIVVGCWGYTGDLDRTIVQLRSAGAQYITTTLLGARDHVISLTEAAARSPATPSTSPESVRAE